MVNDSSKKNHSGKVTPTLMVPCNYQLNTILNLTWKDSQWLSSTSWPVSSSEGSCLNWVNWGEKTQPTMGSTILYVGDPVLSKREDSEPSTRMNAFILWSQLWIWLATSDSRHYNSHPTWNGEPKQTLSLSPELFCQGFHRRSSKQH